jgi:translation initiation factor IF-2
LNGILKSLPTPYDMRIEIEDETIGTITDGDVKNAIAHKAAIIAFNVGATKAAEALATAQLVTIVKSEVIYDLTKAVEAMLKAGTVAKIIGKLELLAVFGKKGVSKNYSVGKQQIIGGKVIEGEIKNGTYLDVTRKDIVVGKGKIINLQNNKRDMARIEMPNECGLLFDADVEVRVGDVLVLR